MYYYIVRFLFLIIYFRQDKKGFPGSSTRTNFQTKGYWLSNLLRPNRLLRKPFWHHRVRFFTYPQVYAPCPAMLFASHTNRHTECPFISRIVLSIPTDRRFASPPSPPAVIGLVFVTMSVALYCQPHSFGHVYISIAVSLENKEMSVRNDPRLALRPATNTIDFFSPPRFNGVHPVQMN